MKIISFSGGLGNQLFQYAFYLYLKDNSDFGNIFLDFSFYESQNKRDAVIRNFYGVDSLDIIKQSSYVRGKFLILKLINKFRFFNNLLEFVDKENGLDETLLSTNKVFFDGYWQSYRYVKDYKSNIKELFSFYDFKGNILEVRKKICQSNSVCMHVRRGDYVAEKNTKLVHGVCSLQYYRDALNNIKNVDNSIDHIFIFSDDIDWVKNNISFDIPVTVVDFVGQSVPDYAEMLLFSCGKHKVIANSTFSWWGAFLSDRNGVIVSPKKWFAKEEKNYDEIFIEGSLRL
ncbi:glycosyl transferase, family 11 [Vibrio paracholerae 87395]|uniref:alpha-1,2-fucosyltransferase n=1 Tax=Vibrio paracholerae TaxID=650003 RepID=UPI0002C17223|nr:alpha-1,2-fucosyltransferase [Vibrio paracholerae]EMP95085.1 glycosyl transferase, family 11 [Vibrio paracholerae 87395]